MNEEILQNIAVIQERINKACKENGRSPKDIKLLLATKTVPAERIKIALQTGQALIAKNNRIHHRFGPTYGITRLGIPTRSLPKLFKVS